MNLLYVLGPLSLSTWHNNEIRYSLRSAEPAGVDWVGIAGPEIPPFLSGIVHVTVHVDMANNRYRNTQSQILAACSDSRVPEELILMNDDFIIRDSRFANALPTHRGLVAKRAVANAWKQSIVDTCSWLQHRGFSDPLNYEGHTPFPFSKSKAAALLPQLLSAKDILQFRTAYGNVNRIGGKLTPNAKRNLPRQEGSPFWSLKSDPSDDAKALLQSQFVSPSRWEAPYEFSRL